MDHEIIETRNDQEGFNIRKLLVDGREPATRETSPLHKSNSITSLPLPSQNAEFIRKLSFKQAVSEPRPNRNRCTSVDMMALRSTRLFDSNKEGEENSFDFGLRRRRGNGSNDNRTMERTTSPDPSRRRDSHARAHNRPRAKWLIDAEHPLKVIWDVVTVVLSLANAYATHVSIRDRRYGSSPLSIFCNVWFLVDILLNFVTERKTAEGVVLRDYRTIAARYLTSWFAIDALSLFPWETVYVKPIIDIQNSRGFFKKSFFRSKAVVRVTTHLRGKHFRWFGNVARHSKQHGIGASRLLRLIIKYLPKYILFLRNMKGIVVMRVLRQFNYLRRFYTNVVVEKGDAMTESLTHSDDFVDDISSVGSGEGRHVQVVYEKWELMDDLDDAVPL